MEEYKAKENNSASLVFVIIRLHFKKKMDLFKISAKMILSMKTLGITPRMEIETVPDHQRLKK